ncbi:hypothetical protein JM946_03830 [Steroidobacter sp. S1-65]|uniref:Uncharacterized protein n=1 Tax=Steroidobacter gossypii TaxID=2805490 RepID=A0ABS1WSA3_9GAMM|nr:hypothetical protein [Steroidobacter gossypii]MBM0103855.1 hypothetical protein [Steroidobacter gossypii]
MSDAETLEMMRRELERLREEMKEREPSVLGGLRTLFADGVKWQRGERDFPRSAALGVLFAYLRPRLVLTVAGIGALVMTGVQVALLKQQNTLIGNQNSLLESQTRSTQLAAVTDVLSKLNSDDKKQTELIIAGLESYGGQALAPLLVIAQGGDSELADRALDAVIRSAKIHEGSQIEDVINLCLSMLQEAVSSEKTNKKLLARGLHVFTRYSDALPAETIKDLPSGYADVAIFIDTLAAKVTELLAKEDTSRSVTAKILLTRTCGFRRRDIQVRGPNGARTWPLLKHLILVRVRSLSGLRTVPMRTIQFSGLWE